ncbi:MAG: hypothetical protein PS018_07870 [bacterium]|nr:hypothetical protein [bacterium]
MRIKTALLAGASLLAMTAHANAMPPLAAAAALLTSSFFAGSAITIAGLSVSTFLSVAFAVGGAIVSALSQRKPNTKAIKQTSQGQEGPGRYAFGRVEVDAQIGFGGTAGYFLSRWLFHCFGPLDGIETYFYDGREITVEPDGYVSTPPWARPPTHPRPSYMNVTTKIGGGTETTPANLLSDFPSTITTDHRARGIAASVMRIENPGQQSARFGRLLQGGIKSLRLLARVGKFYDPRDASTEWTLNGVLHVMHFMRQLGAVELADFDATAVGDAADIAELSILGLTVTPEEPERCRLSGGWEGPLTTDIIQDMMESAGIEEYTTDAGLIGLRLIDDWPQPEITFTLGHGVENYPQAGPESGRRPNICKVSYFSPERRYEKAELDMTGVAWARIEDEITAYGDQEFHADLTFCCNHVQACLIARRLFYMARADFGMLKTNMAGMAAWGLRTALIDIPDVGDNEGTLTVRARLDSARPDDAAGTVEIPYQIIPDILSVAFNPVTDAAPAPPLLVPQQVETDLDTPDEPAEALIVEYPDKTRELRVLYTVPAGGDITEAVYRVYTGSAPGVSQSMTEVDGVVKYAYRQVAYNLWADPTFATGWTLGSGWTSAPPYAVKVAGVEAGLFQTKTIVTGLSYDFTITVSDRTAGAVRPRFAGGTVVEGTGISTNGTFTQTLVGGSGNTSASYRGDASFAGKISTPFLQHSGGHPIIELGTHLDFRVRIFTNDGESSFYSDILDVPSIAIDNTATAAPTQNVTGNNGDWDVETTAPVDLNVAYIQIEKNVALGGFVVASTQNARPGVIYTLNVTDGVISGQTIQIRSRAFTSDGTASAYSAVFSFTET